MLTIAGFLENLLNDKLVTSRADALEVVSYLTEIPFEKIPFFLSQKFNPDSVKLDEVVSKLSESIPVAYVVGRRHFFGRDYYVDENVLIPRYETEFLVQEAIARCDTESPRVLDICTGSGCILLSILGEIPESTGVGLDISKGALGVAKRNSEAFGIDDRVSFINADALKMENLFTAKFDIITCNPPYVAEHEYDGLEKSVKYEPFQALVAPDEGLLFYKKLMDMACNMCNKNGVVLFELGAGQSAAVREFLPDREFEFINDYQGIERVALWTNL